MKKDEIKKLIVAIEKREDWKDTLSEEYEDGTTDSEFLHRCDAFEAFGKVIVFSQFFNRHTSSREFLIWDRKTLRDANEIEAEILRKYDDETPLAEEEEIELTFLIARDSHNMVNRGG